MQYCSLQHQTLFSSPDTSNWGFLLCHFSFLPWSSCFILSGAISNCSLFFPSNILDTFRPVGLIFCCHIFWTFHTEHGVLVARILEWLPLPPLVDHVLLELFTMTHPSWVALHSVAHSFIELHKPLLHHKDLIQRGNHRLPTPQEPAKKTAWWYDLHFLFT